MVLPDGRRSESERPQVGRTTLIVLALIAVGAGILILGSLTPPKPVAVEDTFTTTTVDDLNPPVDLENFSLEQIETGPQLEWFETTEMAAVPRSIIAHRGFVYVFAPADADGKGLRAWRSPDGIGWETLGTVIGATHDIGSIASTSLGLIAIEPDARDDYVHIWGSVDGVSWLEIVDGIPATSNEAGIDFYPSAVAADERVLAVAGVLAPDVTELAEVYLEVRAGTEVDLTGLPVRWASTPEDLYMTIYGPLGFPAERISGTDLGLSEEQREEVSGYFLGRPDNTTIWTKADDGDWQVGEIEGADFINALAPDEEGGLRAFGYGYLPGSWVSHDGVDWERVADNAPSRVEPWGDRLVGIGDSGVSPDILISQRGREWESSGLADLFPEGVDWFPLGFATGSGGIATIVETRVDDGPRGVDESPTLESNGTTLTLDYQRSVVHLDTGDRLYTWSIGVDIIDGIEINLADRTVSFVSPATDDPLATYTFEQLTELETKAHLAGSTGTIHTGLAFSPDGSSWTIQNLIPEIGPDAAVTHIEVTDTHVLGLVTRPFQPDRPYSIEGFEVWAAPLP